MREPEDRVISFRSRPRNLLPQFLLVAAFFFILFSLLSFFLLVRFGKENQSQYFLQVHNTTVSMADQWIQGRMETLRSLAVLPQFRNKLNRELAIYNNQNLSPQEKQRELLLLNLPENNPDQGPPQPGAPPGEGVPGEGIPLKVELLSSGGMVVTSRNTPVQPTAFPYFDALLNARIPGETAGMFTVIRQGEYGEPIPSVYFYSLLQDESQKLLGYLIAQEDLNILNGNGGSRTEMERIGSSLGSEGNFSFLVNRNLYLIDWHGRPISPLKQQDRYEELLKSAGYLLPVSSYPLFDPLSKDLRTSGNTNIRLLSELVTAGDRQTDSPIIPRSIYRNYIHQKVYGGGFWLPSLNLGVIIEFEASRMLHPLLQIGGIILLILFLSTAVFFYLVLWIDRLRLQALDANPLTHLPGNEIINRRIQQILDHHQPAAVVYGDLDHFKVYNDRYGFSMGDKVIRFTAEVLQKVLAQVPSKLTFCGHIGGDDFLFTVPESLAEWTGREIGRLFEEGIRQFYSPEDAKKGFIREKNREGVFRKYPLISFSMAGINVKGNHLTHFLQVANLCGEIKKVAKQQAGSVLVMDRRHHTPESPEPKPEPKKKPPVP